MDLEVSDQTEMMHRLNFAPRIFNTGRSRAIALVFFVLFVALCVVLWSCGCYLLSKFCFVLCIVYLLCFFFFFCLKDRLFRDTLTISLSSS